VKIDTVHADSALRARYEKVRGPFNSNSPIVAILPTDDGLSKSLPELVAWSAKAVRNFKLSYDEVLARLKVNDALSDEDLLSQVRGCDAVISCLGHVISLKGIMGPPRNLVARATKKVCLAIEELQPAKPVKFVLMSSVSVNRPGGLDTRRGRFERACVWMLRGVMPPWDSTLLF
jgi:hypothetical protein